MTRLPRTSPLINSKATKTKMRDLSNLQASSAPPAKEWLMRPYLPTLKLACVITASNRLSRPWEATQEVTSFRLGLPETDRLPTACVDCRCAPTRTLATNAKARTPSILKEKLLKSRRRAAPSESTGMCSWARNSTPTRTRATRSTRTCRVWRVCSSRAKWRRCSMTTSCTTPSCSSSPTNAEFTTSKLKSNATSGSKRSSKPSVTPTSTTSTSSRSPSARASTAS
mmetsp:Transcript_702/g.872  ORF Transcript_702/g.872 Transcript_702/m.872 type:complete len:226 (+) Transcript_702:1114-1791(+)